MYHFIPCKTVFVGVIAAEANILKKIWFLGSTPDPAAGDDPKNYSTTLMDKFFEFWWENFMPSYFRY